MVIRQTHREERVMLNDLLNCPFCGGKAEYFNTGKRTTGHGESSDDAGVTCTDCGAGFSLGDYAGYKVEERQQEAKKLWNTRAN